MFHVFCFVFLAGISCYFFFLYFFALIHLSQEAFPRPGNSASSSPVRPVFPHFSLPLVSLVNIVAFELWTQSTKWSFYWVPRSGGGGDWRTGSWPPCSGVGFPGSHSRDRVWSGGCLTRSTLGSVPVWGYGKARVHRGRDRAARSPATVSVHCTGV